MKTLALVAAITLATTTSIAVAASPEHGHQFNKLDTNADGRLSREEVAAYPALAQRFGQIDVNKDGFLSRQELESKRSAGLCG